MGKVRTWDEPDGNGGQDHRCGFMCPACKHEHVVSTRAHNWNHDTEHPTFAPSILVTWVDYTIKDDAVIDEKSIKEMICHSFIKSGNIQFLDDCTHEFAGKTKTLPEHGDSKSSK